MVRLSMWAITSVIPMLVFTARWQSARRCFIRSDIIAQAQSGVMAMTGEPDGPPEYVGNYFGDPNAGIHGALAICAALFHRATTGEGQYIDVSQLESLVYLDYINFPLFLMSQGAIQPHRFGGDFFNIC